MGVNASDFEFDSVYGVDFSGAKLAGRNTWVARLDALRRGRRGTRALRLAGLSSLEVLCGNAERKTSLGHLVKLVRESDRALWAMDFPFSLPIEVRPDGAGWPAQLRYLHGNGDAYAVGLECLDRARKLGGALHIRRTTDLEAKTPFDCYHYRIIYQFFHGVRDVLGPLWPTRGTAILPFQYRKLARARRVIVEACPSSTLKRLGLPHQNYKQPAGGPLSAKRRRTRKLIVDGLSSLVAFDELHRRILMQNPGGDALDAVLAAVGAAQAWASADHPGIARHPRYPREGKLYV